MAGKQNIPNGISERTKKMVALAQTILDESDEEVDSVDSSRRAEDNEEEVEIPRGSTGRPSRALKRKSLKEVDEESDEEEVATPSRKRKPPKDDDDEEDEGPSEADAEGSDDEEAAPKPSSSKKKNKHSKKSQPKDDADESENEENEKPLPKKSGRKKKETVKEQEPEYEVEKIVDDRAIKGRIQYKIRWKGYLSEDDTWENESTLDCTEYIEEYNDAKGDDSKANGSSDPPAAKAPKSRGRSTKTDTKKGKEKQQQKAAASDSKRGGKDKRYAHSAPDKNGEWEVLKIVDMHTLKNGSREFLVRWKGYPPEDDSWEPESHLQGTDILERFLKKVEQNDTVATLSRSGGRQTPKVNYNDDEPEGNDEEEDTAPPKRGRPRKPPILPHFDYANRALGGVTLPEIANCVSAVVDKKVLAKQGKLDEILDSVAKQDNKLDDLIKSVDELRKENEALRQTVEHLQSKMAA